MTDNVPTWRRRSLRQILESIGEKPGLEVPAPSIAAPAVNPGSVSRTRRDYTAAELREMAELALQGVPRPGSPAAYELRRCYESGDFERALALVAEVKEKAPDLARLARAAEKAERRAKRGVHIHICKDYPHACGPGGMGPCECKCGAVLELKPGAGLHAWHLPDGTWAPFPDPREAEHPKARRMNGKRGG